MILLWARQPTQSAERRYCVKLRGSVKSHDKFSMEVHLRVEPKCISNRDSSAHWQEHIRAHVLTFKWQYVLVWIQNYFHFLFGFWRTWVTDYSWKNISRVTMNRHEPSRTVLFVPGSQVLKLTCHLSWLNNSSQTNHLSDKKGRDREDYVTANE